MAALLGYGWWCGGTDSDDSGHGGCSRALVASWDTGGGGWEWRPVTWGVDGGGGTGCR